MSAIRIGPARVPSRESPEAAVELLLERNYTACEIDCEGGLSTGEPMVPPWAPSFAASSRAADVAHAGKAVMRRRAAGSLSVQTFATRFERPRSRGSAAA
jgi:hypothetical protein